MRSKINAHPPYTQPPHLNAPNMMFLIRRLASRRVNGTMVDWTTLLKRYQGKRAARQRVVQENKGTSSLTVHMHAYFCIQGGQGRTYARVVGRLAWGAEAVAGFQEPLDCDVQSAVHAASPNSLGEENQRISCWYFWPEGRLSRGSV